MKTVDQRRVIMDAANNRGLVVKGRDGSKLPASVYGVQNRFAGVHVKTTFGDQALEYAWETIERAVNGDGELLA